MGEINLFDEHINKKFQEAIENNPDMTEEEREDFIVSLIQEMTGLTKGKVRKALKQTNNEDNFND